MRFIPFLLTTLLVATTALAYDMTYLPVIPPKGDITQAVELPAGNSTLTVRGSHDQNLSCSVVDVGTGNIASPSFEQVPLCLFNATGLVIPAKVLVKVHNHSDETLQIYMQVVDAKP